MSPPDYINEMYRPDDRIAIVMISRSDDGRVLQRIMDAGNAASDKYQAWFRHMNSQEMDPRKDKNGRPFDIYVGMNRLHPHATGRHKEDIAEIKHVFMDIDKDGPAALEKILKHPAMAEPNYILESSPEKYQVIWKVNDFTPERAETLSRNMVREFGADRARIDVSSILRLPGFKNGKYPELNHYVKVERLSDKVVTPKGFPDDLLERRERETAERMDRPHSQKRGIEEDQSRKDFRYACNALRKGRDPGEIAREIDRYRAGEKHWEYGQRTVHAAQKAVAHDVQQEHYR